MVSSRFKSKTTDCFEFASLVRIFSLSSRLAAAEADEAKDIAGAC